MQYSEIQRKIVAETAAVFEITNKDSFVSFLKNEELLDVSRYSKAGLILLNSKIPTGTYKFLAADNDGTISRIRDGWEDIMKSCLIKWITGDDSNLITTSLVWEVEEMIRRTTGITTIFQMDLAVKLVKKYGFVGSKEIKVAEEYKVDYLANLMGLVEKRKKQIENNGVMDDCVIEGAEYFYPILCNLIDKKIIFSGTDDEDVKQELELLGFGELFDNVYGAVGRRDKKDVLRQILKEYTVKANEGLIIGDGPVEIKLAKEYKFTAIGVCSSSIKEGKWNQEKVKMLTKAGADILIPDYTASQYLIDILFGCEIPAKRIHFSAE